MTSDTVISVSDPLIYANPNPHADIVNHYIACREDLRKFLHTTARTQLAQIQRHDFHSINVDSLLINLLDIMEELEKVKQKIKAHYPNLQQDRTITVILSKTAKGCLVTINTLSEILPIGIMILKDLPIKALEDNPYTSWIACACAVAFIGVTNFKDLSWWKNKSTKEIEEASIKAKKIADIGFIEADSASIVAMCEDLIKTFWCLGSLAELQVNKHSQKSYKHHRPRTLPKEIAEDPHLPEGLPFSPFYTQSTRDDARHVPSSSQSKTSSNGSPDSHLHFSESAKHQTPPTIPDISSKPPENPSPAPHHVRHSQEPLPASRHVRHSQDSLSSPKPQDLIRHPSLLPPRLTTEIFEDSLLDVPEVYSTTCVTAKYRRRFSSSQQRSFETPPPSQEQEIFSDPEPLIYSQGGMPFPLEEEEIPKTSQEKGIQTSTSEELLREEQMTQRIARNFMRELLRQEEQEHQKMLHLEKTLWKAIFKKAQIPYETRVERIHHLYTESEETLARFHLMQEANKTFLSLAKYSPHQIVYTWPPRSLTQREKQTVLAKKTDSAVKRVLIQRKRRGNKQPEYQQRSTGYVVDDELSDLHQKHSFFASSTSGSKASSTSPLVPETSTSLAPKRRGKAAVKLAPTAPAEEEQKRAKRHWQTLRNTVRRPRGAPSTPLLPSTANLPPFSPPLLPSQDPRAQQHKMRRLASIAHLLASPIQEKQATSHQETSQQQERFRPLERQQGFMLRLNRIIEENEIETLSLDNAEETWRHTLENMEAQLQQNLTLPPKTPKKSKFPTRKGTPKKGS